MPALRRTAPVAIVAVLAVLVLLTTTDRAAVGSERPQAAGGPTGGSTGGSTGETPADAVASSGGFDPMVGQERPNIVVIMADDMRDDDVRFMPNVRRLIGAQGVRFTNTFSPHPLCCPARASFLTGQYSHNHEVWSHADPYGFRVLDDAQTLPVWLREVGYNTGFVGKYLNGYGRQPLRDGSSSVRYVPPGWTDWRGSVDGGMEKDSEYDGGTYRYYDTTLNVNGALKPHQGRYNTRLFGDQTDQVLRQFARSPRPFFYYTSYVAPHVGSPTESDDPVEVQRPDGSTDGFGTPARPADVIGDFDRTVTKAPGADGEQDVSGKPFFLRRLPQINRAEQEALAEVTRQRAESLKVVDQQVARTIRTLEETGELDDTVVLFTSDNGFFLGEHRDRTGKILPYEPSLRVPLLMRGPGIPAGENRADPFTMIDFAPTLLQAAGARPDPDFDGKSLWDVARTGDRGWTRGILTETGPRRVGSGVEESDNFLVRGDGPSPLRFSQGLRTPHYLYVEHASRERELYDMRTDPKQNDNVVDRPDRQDVVAQLSGRLDRLRDCAGAGCRAPLPRTLQQR